MRVNLAAVAGAALLSAGAMAQDAGFLDDYSLIERFDDVYADGVYIAPGALERLAEYDRVMVDQPEIFVSPDSPYKGVKPDALKALADTMREGITERLAGRYQIVEESGPGVLYVNWAITHLYLQKKKRGLLAYTPVGFVVTSTVRAATKDLWKKTDIVEMTWEAELLDSGTGEVLAALVVAEGARKDKAAGQKKRDPVTWEEIDAMTATFGDRLRCRLDNARTPEDRRVDCRSIVVEPVEG